MKAYHRTRQITHLSLLLAALCFTLPLHGAAYIKIGSIDGESQDRGHEGEIDVLAWDWGMSRETETAGGGGGAGKADFKKLTAIKELDKSSPLLMLHCATGEALPTAALTMRRSSGTDGGEAVEYLKITLTNVTISSYNTSSSSDGDRPIEEITLNFSQIEVQYVPQDPATGEPQEPVLFAWDIAGNTGG